MTYTLGIELEINGTKVKQDLVTLGLKALEKYTAYCKDFSEFIMYLRKTDTAIADYLKECSASFQPLYIKKEDEDGELTYDIPVLFKKDLDILLINQDELLKLFDLPEDVIASMEYEDQLMSLIKLKKENNVSLLRLLSGLDKKIDVTDKYGKPRVTTVREQRYESLKAWLKEVDASYVDIVKLIRENVKSVSTSWQKKQLQPEKKVGQPSDEEIKISLESKLKTEEDKNSEFQDVEIIKLLKSLVAQIDEKIKLNAELYQANEENNTDLAAKKEDELKVCEKEFEDLNHLLVLREQLRNSKDEKESRYLLKLVSLYEEKHYLENEIRSCPENMKVSEDILMRQEVCEDTIRKFENGELIYSDAGLLIEVDNTPKY